MQVICNIERHNINRKEPTDDVNLHFDAFHHILILRAHHCDMVIISTS